MEIKDITAGERYGWWKPEEWLMDSIGMVDGWWRLEEWLMEANGMVDWGQRMLEKAMVYLGQDKPSPVITLFFSENYLALASLALSPAIWVYLQAIFCMSGHRLLLKDLIRQEKHTLIGATPRYIINWESQSSLLTSNETLCIVDVVTYFRLTERYV